MNIFRRYFSQIFGLFGNSSQTFTIFRRKENYLTRLTPLEPSLYTTRGLQGVIMILINENIDSSVHARHFGLTLGAQSAKTANVLTKRAAPPPVIRHRKTVSFYYYYFFIFFNRYRSTTLRLQSTACFSQN